MIHPRKYLRSLLSVIALSVATIGISAKPITYHISGNVVGSRGVVTLKVMKTLNEWVTINEVEIQDGKFEFSGTTEGGYYSHISFDDHPDLHASGGFFLEEGAHVIITGDVVTLETMGGPSTEAFQKHFKLEQDITRKIREEGGYNYSPIDNHRANSISENTDNHAGAFIYGLLVSYSAETPEEIERELARFAPAVLDSSPYLRLVKNRLEHMKLVAVGSLYIDIAMPDAKGNTIKLSDQLSQGKYVLLDFWASWCGPCMRSMPELKDLYDKFESKGFEIYAVSLDKNHDEWLETIRDYNMRWINVSDTKYWDCETAQAYGIKAIPHSFLISPDGYIIWVSHYLDSLEEILTEKLGTQKTAKKSRKPKKSRRQPN